MTEKEEIASEELKKEFTGEAEKELEKVGGGAFGMSNPVAGLTEEEARKRAAELDAARDRGSAQTMSGAQFMKWWRASNNIPEPGKELSEEAAALVSGGQATLPLLSSERPAEVEGNESAAQLSVGVKVFECTNCRILYPRTGINLESTYTCPKCGRLCILK